MAKLLKAKNINFYASFYRKPPLTEEQIRKRVFILVPSGVAAVLILVSGVIYFQIIHSNYKIGEIKSYLNDPEIAAIYNDVKATQDKTKDYQKEYDYLKNINDILKDYPKFTSDNFAKIYSCASGATKVESISYDNSSGIVTMIAEAPKMDYASQTVTALRGTGLFDDVQYTGYESNNSGVYAFEAYCLMKGGDAK